MSQKKKDIEEQKVKKLPFFNLCTFPLPPSVSALMESNMKYFSCDSVFHCFRLQSLTGKESNRLCLTRKFD